MKTCIVIPVHNESGSIGPLVDAILKRNFAVVVIDDGSSDNSGEIARQKGAFVIRHDPKKGKGQALQTGFRYALEHDFDNVITMDGDGQHDAGDIDVFLQRSQAFPASVINGSRMSGHRGMPWLRLVTNKVMSALISWACKQTIPDTQCGFRLIDCAVLRQINLSSSGFEIETEVLIKAAKKGFKIYSVPIRTIYRNEVSKINPLVDTIRFIVYFCKEMWTTKS